MGKTHDINQCAWGCGTGGVCVAGGRSSYGLALPKVVARHLGLVFMRIQQVQAARAVRGEEVDRLMGAHQARQSSTCRKMRGPWAIGGAGAGRGRVEGRRAMGGRVVGRGAK